MTKKNITFGSILIGFLTVGLLGFSVYSGLIRLEIINSSSLLMIISITIGSIVGMLLGIKYPITTEAVSFAITAFIFSQAVWDTIYDIQKGFFAPRVIVGSIAAFIFILNIFTGELKKGTAKKQIKRTLGTK